MENTWYLLLIVKSHETFLHTQGLFEMSKVMLKRQYSAIAIFMVAMLCAVNICICLWHSWCFQFQSHLNLFIMSSSIYSVLFFMYCKVFS